MKIIKNSEELKRLVNEYNDLICLNDDIRIEFEPTKEEIRNVECRDLFLMNDNRRFDFNGMNFNGVNFNGGDFNGGNFNGRDFNGGNFNGRDFNGRNFNGRNFNGRDFNGGNFNGMNFNGWNFNGGNFNGGNFNGWDFNGRNFNGKKVSYWAFFNCYGSIKCESIESRREPHAEPVCLDGKIEIIKPDEPKEDNIITLSNGAKVSEQTIREALEFVAKNK